MKAISYDRTGPSSVLQLVERELREPGPDEVRVRVVVSGVNPTDWKARRGGAEPKPLATPQTPNQDGAGVVDAVGAAVDALAVGDRVWLWDAAWQRPEGTAQEYVTLPARQAVLLPPAASFDVGAAVGIPALTAHRALTAHEAGPAQLAPGALAGRVVLVTGGAGAVGHAALQLARWAGATVITTVSGPEKAELARRAGAEHVINYRQEDVAARVHEICERGADVIVDVNPIANLTADLAAAAPGATLALYASESDDPLSVPVRPSMVSNLRFQFILTYTVTEAQKAAAVAAVSAALADGVLGVGDAHGLPIIRYPLAETAAAHDAVQQAVVGKVLVDVSPP